MAPANTSCNDLSGSVVAELSSSLPSRATNQGVPCAQPVLSAGGADNPSSTTATLGLAATKSSFGLLSDPTEVAKATYTDV